MEIRHEQDASQALICALTTTINNWEYLVATTSMGFKQQSPDLRLQLLTLSSSHCTSCLENAGNSKNSCDNATNRNNDIASSTSVRG